MSGLLLYSNPARHSYRTLTFEEWYAARELELERDEACDTCDDD